MSRKLFRTLAAMLLGLALTGSSAFARNDKHDGDHDRGHGRIVRAGDRGRDHDRDDRRFRRDRDGDHDRDRFRRVRHGDRDRNPHSRSGWDNGHKTGWHNSALPPGQNRTPGNNRPVQTMPIQHRPPFTDAHKHPNSASGVNSRVEMSHAHQN